jgi:hypothetical protein
MMGIRDLGAHSPIDGGRAVRGVGWGRASQPPVGRARHTARWFDYA